MKPWAPPLRELVWDGCTLSLRLDPGHDIELWVDGCRFKRWPAGAADRLQQAFTFTPNGRMGMRVVARSAGMALHAPVRLCWGEPGVLPAAGPVSPMRLLDPHAEHYMVAASARVDPPPVCIIVPVYNASAAVTRCLAALRQHTPAPARLLLIDDASTDPAIAPLLQVARDWPNVRLLHNADNLGYTRSVNRGLDACQPGEDVVLLNADTEVGPGWLAGLRQAAWARADHASATAVSDNAGAFSVPELEQANPLPHVWGIADAARAQWQQAGRAFPYLPTGNGFCMYLRHDARAAVGQLDADAFAAGYGEENDWCQRAEQRGWRHVIAGSVLVGHARSQSFGEARREALGLAGMEVLRRRYPGYEDRIGASLFSFARLVLDWRTRSLWHDAAVAPRARVLLADDHNADAWSGWAAWRLQHNAGQTRLLDAEGHERGMVAAADSHAAAYRWLQRHAFEAVSAAADSDLARVAHALGLPVAEAPAKLPWAFR